MEWKAECCPMLHTAAQGTGPGCTVALTLEYIGRVLSPGALLISVGAELHNELLLQLQETNASKSVLGEVRAVC